MKQHLPEVPEVCVKLHNTSPTWWKAPPKEEASPPPYHTLQGEGGGMCGKKTPGVLHRRAHSCENAVISRDACLKTWSKTEERRLPS